ncbi:MAG: lysophospholipid acyltransferase family protein [Betaproteobacteria bacterium]
MRALALLLAPLRLAVLLLHVLGGLLVAALVFPLLRQPARNRIIRLWSHNLLRIVGLRLVVRGEPIEPEVAATGLAAWSSGRILLANHISWIDIFAINAAVPTRFIAKAEISRWPLVGALVSLAGTLYVERGRRHAVHAINQKVAERLKHGETIGVFPEGTTTDGSTLLPFHANLVQPALDAGAEIRPVALRYTQRGAPTLAAAYIGDDNLVSSLWRIVTAPALAVDVHWLAPLSTQQATRHAAGREAREAIAGALGLVDVSPASAPADTATAAAHDPANARP